MRLYVFEKFGWIIKAAHKILENMKISVYYLFIETGQKLWLEVLLELRVK